ncbi:hypothetical protein HK096_005155 [Nowakowskiella sp. JEL0078]|nr:hypothetical protein HK096_005155 [Nowakowskiella sp. JEL0078]
MKVTGLSTSILSALAILQLASSAPLEARRFGQEQNVGLGAKISAVSSGCPSNGDGSLGFSGSEIKFLLAAADPCGKLTLADQVVAKAKTCPTGPKEKIISIAMELVAAEKNFNPFNTLLDSVCLTSNLPASVELQGILQKVDPRTTAPNNNDAALQKRAAALNAKAASVLAAAKAAGKGPGSGGKSMADLLAANGFADIQNFKGTATGGNTNTGTGGNTGAVATQTTESVAAQATATAAAAGSGAASSLGTCSAAAAQLVVKLGADPEGERAQEVRFITGGFKVDPIFGGQGSALNGGIVANFICDRLGDQCKAPASTVTACRAAQKKVEGNKGGKNLSAAQLLNLEKIADDFNAAIGIKTNQAGGSSIATVPTTTTGSGTGKNVDIAGLIALLQQAVALLKA